MLELGYSRVSTTRRLSDREMTREERQGVSF